MAKRKSNKQVKEMLEPIYIYHIESRKSFRHLAETKPCAMPAWLSYQYNILGFGDDIYKGKCTVSIKACDYR